MVANISGVLSAIQQLTGGKASNPLAQVEDELQKQVDAQSSSDSTASNAKQPTAAQLTKLLMNAGTLMATMDANILNPSASAGSSDPLLNGTSQSSTALTSLFSAADQGQDEGIANLLDTTV